MRLGRHEALKHLLPGLGERQIRQEFSACGLVASEGTLSLYSWHNGSDPNSPNEIGDLTIIPGFYLLTLEEAVQLRETFLDDPRWRPDWVPFMADGGRDFYVSSGSLGSDGEVLHFCIDEVETPTLSKSMSEFLEKIAHCFSAGIFFVDDEGLYEMDDLSYTRLLGDF